MKNIDKMRPIEIHDKALLLREECGVKFYLKENENFVDINCPVCDKNNNEENIAFYKYGFRHLTCETCKTLYVSPRPVENKLFEYYEQYEAPNFI